MRKVMFGAAVALALVLGGLISTVAVEAAPTAIDVTVTGQNYSVINTLAKDQAADALPGLAELNALKVSSIKGADGKEIPGMNGKTLYYIPVKGAADLALGKAQVGKNVEIKGEYFKAENAILVGEFKPAAASDFDELPTKTVTRQQVL